MESRELYMEMVNATTDEERANIRAIDTRADDKMWQSRMEVARTTKRVNEYPPIEEQLDKIFHEGIDAWKEEIQAIKDKYPKV